MFRHIQQKRSSWTQPDDDRVCILVSLALTMGDLVDEYCDILDELVSRGPNKSDPVMEARSPSLVLPPQLVEPASLNSSSSIETSSDSNVQLISMSRDAVLT